MDVNRGDRFDYLVSLDSKEASRSAFIKAKLPADHPRQGDVLQGGNMNLTLIRTWRGKSILLNHDICSPRPYSRTNLLSGTKGIFWGMPWRRPGGINDLFQIGFEEEPGKGIPDFTRGAWRTMAPIGDIDVDLSKLDLRRVRKDESQIKI